MSGDTRCDGFRTFYSNIFSVTFTGQEVGITFGIQTKPGADSVDMEAQTAAYMTHSGAKLLISMLGLLLDDYEIASGRPIEWDASKLDVLKEQIAQNRASREAGKKD